MHFCKKTPNRMGIFPWIALFSFLAILQPAVGENQEQCQLVRFAEPGWTDISATTAIATQILQKLGYQTSSRFLSVPVIYSALAMGDIDIFLGYWNPSMLSDFRPYEKEGTVETVRFNLTGAKYSLAVPKYVYDAGLKTFDDMIHFADQLNFSLYGVEPGNDGNRIILSMIENNAHNLGKFRLVESSEQAMLSELEAQIATGHFMVFLGWEPHPMNSRFDIVYLSGGDEFFGPNYGDAKVGTNVRKNYLQQCPNVGQFLLNLEFSVDIENELMDAILNEQKDPQDVANQWIGRNMAIVTRWLDGVKTLDGSDSIAHIRSLYHDAD